LLLIQHEAERPHADEVVRQCAFEESGVAALLGGGPILREFGQFFGPIVHDPSPP